MRFLTEVCNEKAIVKRTEELEQILKGLEKVIATSPEGSIHAMQKGKYCEYYYRTSAAEKTGRYLRKNERKIVGKIVQREYAEKASKLVKEELALLEKIRKAIDINEKIKNLYSNAIPGLKKYISPIDISDQEYKELWLKEDYVRKGNQNLLTEFYTENGEHVRSKSELMIANILLKRGIAYKYEKPMQMPNGQIFHPDFTVLDEKRRKEFIWEHLGMVDNRTYLENVIDRMEQYKRKGIYPGVEMIVTYETGDKPISTMDINAIIDRYFEV